jgi:hypothetical protein
VTDRALSADSILDHCPTEILPLPALELKPTWRTTNLKKSMEYDPMFCFKTEKNEKLVHSPGIFITFGSTRRSVIDFLFFLPYHSNSVYKIKRTFDHYYW